MKVLVDMNLSPAWVDVFERQGWHAVHWSRVGDPRATDRAIMDWARANGYIAFTHDLDFGAILAVTHAEGSSVLQVRTQDVFPEHLADVVVAALQQFTEHLEAGALITVDDSSSRVRILPIHR